MTQRESTESPYYDQNFAKYFSHLEPTKVENIADSQAASLHCSNYLFK